MYHFAYIIIHGTNGTKLWTLHLASQRLSRPLVLGDKAKEHLTIHQGDDLNLFIFQICNLFSF